MPRALGALAGVERTEVGIAADADQRGGVEDALQAPVIALRTVQVAADPARVPGNWCHAGKGRQAVRRGEGVQPTAATNSAPRTGPNFMTTLRMRRCRLRDQAAACLPSSRVSMACKTFVGLLGVLPGRDRERVPLDASEDGHYVPGRMRSAVRVERPLAQSCSYGHRLELSGLGAEQGERGCRECLGGILPAVAAESGPPGNHVLNGSWPPTWSLAVAIAARAQQDAAQKSTQAARSPAGMSMRCCRRTTAPPPRRRSPRIRGIRTRPRRPGMRRNRSRRCRCGARGLARAVLSVDYQRLLKCSRTMSGSVKDC